MSTWLCVLVPTPAHSALGPVLTYRSTQPLPPGTLVRVPLGKRETLGVVWEPAAAESTGEIDPDKVRDIAAVLEGIAPLPAPWQQLVRFAAQYYQRSTGEVALAALPLQLRDLSREQLQRRLKRKPAAVASTSTSTSTTATTANGEQATPAPALSAEQTHVLAQIHRHSGPFLLFGATGSGKTEVYLRSVQDVLANNAQAQALVMVPEINLTPQLEARFLERFAPLFGPQAVVSLHSGMTPAQRLGSWLAAHSGSARIVLGTRMAVFASLPCLRLIVVDEEHDPSYKSSEGARYSARDLAVYRGKLEGAKVLLGSATPSLESWHHSRPTSAGGRYQRLLMPSRMGQVAGQAQQAGPGPVSAHAAAPISSPTAAPTSQPTSSPTSPSTTPPSHAAARHAMRQQSGTPPGLPLVRRVDMNHQPRKTLFSPPLLEAIRQRVARGEQCLVFLNRRGYAPVLHCADCGWKSQCPHCSAYRVFHKIDRTLRCHHCGFTERVPRACPVCGNPDIEAIGRGTEQIEEKLAELLADVRRPGSHSAAKPQGEPLCIVRIDADSTRHKGTLEAQLAAVHSGAVDILVGTQMIAKGHDFRRITLVAAINPDGALFSSDFRAPERLFCLLMQAAGRAGRDAALGDASEVWIQTHQPAHPLYAALKTHDYPAFAEQQLKERKQAGMPPFSAQALVRAEARSQQAAQAFLNLARASALQDMAQWPGWAEVLAQVFVYSAVPMAIQRVANVERAQMLVESPSRSALQQFLAAWHSVLHATRSAPACKGLMRWAVDVDPLGV